MLPAKSRYYMMHGLSAAPVVIERMLRDTGPEEFDRRPDPDRFTIREVMGHLADWEGVWMERASRMANEENPHLQGYDEGQWAIDHGYAHMDLAEQIARFRTGRERLVTFLNALKPEDWSRTCTHDEWGPSNIEAMAVLILGHDGYHTKQIAEWLDR